MKKLLVAAALAVGAIVSTPASAGVPVNVVIEGGGVPIIYQSGSTYYAVLGLNTRGADGDLIVNQTPTTVDLDYVKGLVTNGQAGRISNVLFDANADGFFGPETSYSIGDEVRFFNAFLLEFTGTGNILFGQAFGGGTATLGVNLNNVRGAPPLAAAVPEPSNWALLILGFGAAGVAMRRRKAAVRVAYA